ncbi:MAG: hypothetical protein AAF710_04825 [Planctomycetota bacterium]
MNNKDFGLLQRHVEKLALGIGVLVLLGVGATQFLLGEPNAVELDNRTVAPGEIADVVADKADRLDGRLDGASNVEPIDVPAYARVFVDTYRLPVATDQRLSPIDAGPLADAVTLQVEPEYPAVVLPTPPVPTDLLVKQGHGVLAAGEPRAAELLEMVGNPDPADFQYVTVRATFSFDELQRRYEAADVPEAQRMTRGLWADRLAVTSVRLIREEQDPATGRWGNRVTIDPLPGRPAFVPEARPDLGFERSQELEDFVKTAQVEIRRPPFPAIENGPWTPPSSVDRVFTAEELQRQNELKQQIDRLERQLRRLTGQEGRDAARESTRPRRNAERDFVDEFDTGPERRGNRPQRETTRLSPEERRRASIEEQLDTLRAELNGLLGVEEDLDTADGPGRDEGFGGPGFFDETTPGPGGFGRPGGFGPGPGNAGVTPDIQNPGEVKVWAHDLTVEPGKTYRYKVEVGVLNPLYRFTRLPPKQKQENANRPSLGPDPEELEAAEWSTPIELDPEFYYFVIGGNKDQKRAKIEVWRIYNGVWRSQEFTELPGNEVGGDAEIEGVPRRVPMNVGPLMLDVDSVTAGGQPAVRVLLLEPDTGRIVPRLVTEDKDSEDRLRVRLDASLQQQAQADRLSAGP